MSEDDDSERPSVASLRDFITLLDGNSRHIDVNEFEDDDVDRERKYVHLAGLQDHYAQKGAWSKSVGRLMMILIVFQCLLLWRVGTGAWNFEKYQWLLPALLIQNFGQIVGLALIVVKALFSDIKD